MKLSELKVDEWDGTYKCIAEYKDKKILLLHFVNMIGLKEEGRKNLICIDKLNSIVWIAETPKMGRNFGWFKDFKIENSKLVGWYGGSVFVEVDMRTGEILKEEFIK